MEEYEEQWRKGISKTTQDFQFDEELGFSRVSDGATEIIGGIIASKTIKYTKNNKTMCFLTIEDIMGSVEVVVFPRDYERYHLLSLKKCFFIRILDPEFLFLLSKWNDFLTDQFAGGFILF